VPQHALQTLATAGKRPAAVVVVHAYGVPAMMQPLQALCQQYQVPLIEDAAGALGSTLHQKALGTLAPYGVLSFNYNKIITTLGGGALLLQSKEKAARARFLSNQAKASQPWYEHPETGFNYRINGFAAAAGTMALEEIKARLAHKAHIQATYATLMQPLGFKTLEVPQGGQSNHWLSVFINNSQPTQTLITQLRQKGIEAAWLWKPLHLQNAFKTYKHFLNGAAQTMFEHGLALPSGNALTTNQLQIVIEAIEHSYAFLKR